MNNFKPLLGITIAIFFIYMGFHLITKEDNLAIITGYANIIFFSGLIIFAIIKLLSKRNKV